MVNKWDLAKGRADAEAFGDYLTSALQFLSYAPIAFTTATDSRNIQSTIDVAATLFKQARRRVTTGELNRAMAGVLEQHQPPADKRGGQPRIYYATQISVCPPTIVFFMNNPAMLKEHYRRFVAGRMREALPFDEIPIRFVWRVRTSRPPKRPHDSPAGRPGRDRRS